MRIKDGFELREICGEHVILSHGMDNIDFSKIISLNKTTRSAHFRIKSNTSFYTSRPLFCFFKQKRASISGERKIIRLRKQFFSPQILETASAYRPKTFLKMKSGEAVEARFFSIRHGPTDKRMMSKRQAGHAPNLHSPSPLAARAAFRPGTMAQRRHETLTRCSRHNARDSRISVHLRHGSRIAESRERLVDILSKR